MVWKRSFQIRFKMRHGVFVVAILMFCFAKISADDFDEKRIYEDNIALPDQRTARQYVLHPTANRHPGMRARRPVPAPTTAPAPIAPTLIAPAVPMPKSGVIGNLLPQERLSGLAQVVALNVACQKEAMAVRLAFDKPFPGIIYSKGHYGVPQCHYVAPNSMVTEFTFGVKLGQCGTQFIETAGQPAYLEDVVIIQNDAGIQEVWDSARSVRCIFDGSGSESRQILSAGFNVATIEQQVVSFSAAMQAAASLDIQVGRGPFAPSASGLVKIGELMTLVVSVEGAAGADVLVRQCAAHDGTTTNAIQLTDENGCILKKKLMGSWQKTSETGAKSQPVVAYSHFQAFKFPDKMDVFIECQVDLCHGACPSCPEDMVHISGRKRRAVQFDQHPSRSHETHHFRNVTSADTFGEPVTVARRLRVLSPDDISAMGDSRFSSVTLVAKTSDSLMDDDVCMSIATFVGGLVAMLIVLVMSSALTAILCVRVRTIASTSSTYPAENSFHAFSTVSGKAF